MRTLLLYPLGLILHCLFFAFSAEASKKEEDFPQRISVQARFKPIPCENDVKVQMKRTELNGKEKKVILFDPINLYSTQHKDPKKLHGQNKSIQLIYTGGISQIKDFSFQPLGEEQKLIFKELDVLFEKQFTVQTDSFLEEYYHEPRNSPHRISKKISLRGGIFWHCYGGHYVPRQTAVKNIQQTYFMISHTENPTKILPLPVYFWKRYNAPPPKDKIFPHPLYREVSETIRYIDLSPNSPPPTSLAEDIHAGKLEISLDRPNEICFYKSKSYIQNDLGSELVTIIYEKIGSLPKVSSPQETPLSFSEEQAKELSFLLEENLEISPKDEKVPSKLNKKHRYRSPKRKQNTSYTKLRNGIISELSKWEEAKDKLSYGEVNLPNVLRTVGYGGVYALDLMSTCLDKTLNTLTHGDYGVFQEIKHKGANFARTVIRRAVRLTTDNPIVAQEVGDYAYLMLSVGGGKKLGNYLKVEKLSRAVSKQSANAVKRARNIETLTTETRSLRALDLADGEKISRPSKLGLRNALSQNDMVKYNFKSEIFSPAITWTSSKGTKQTYKVYQRNDIDWNMVRTKGHESYIGKTNLQAALEAGYTPQLKNGELVQIHHIGQDVRGPLIEVSGHLHNTRNQKNFRPLHNLYGVNKGHPEFKVDHGIWNSEKVIYWKERAKNEQK